MIKLIRGSALERRIFIARALCCTVARADLTLSFIEVSLF
jgi:hypothetical protein